MACSVRRATPYGMLCPSSAKVESSQKDLRTTCTRRYAAEKIRSNGRSAFHPKAIAACTLGVPFHNNCRRRGESTQLCCRRHGRFGFDSVKSLSSQPNKKSYCLARCRLVTMVCSHASVLPESSRAADGKDVSQLACE